MTGRSVSVLERKLRMLEHRRDISINTGDIIRANRQIDRLERRMDRLRNLGRGGAGAGMGIGGAIAFGVAAYQGQESLGVAAANRGKNTAIDFATQGNGAATVAMLRKESDRLGASFEATRDGALSLYGAMRTGKIPLEQQHEIVKGIMEAGSAMQISSEAQTGALLALSQMASKGTVAAEELRGQLGERIPGAMGLAAKSMGMTEQKFNDMLNKGKIMADQFLPRFAAELRNTFGAQAAQNAEGATAVFNRMHNSLYDLKVIVGEQLLPTAVSFINNALIPAAKWIGEHIDLISTLGAGILAFAGTMKVITALQWLYNIALTANPIGLVIAGIAALAALFAVAYAKLDTFRGGVHAAWEGIKAFAVLIKDMVINRIKELISGIAGIGETLMYFFSGEWKKAFETGKQAVLDLTGVGTARKAYEGAKNVGKKTLEGYAYGLSKGGKKPSLPGVPDTSAVTSTTGAGTLPAFDASGLEGKTKGITGGGVRTINITIGKFFEDININTQTLTEGTTEIEAKVREVFHRFLNSTNALQTN